LANVFGDTGTRATVWAGHGAADADAPPLALTLGAPDAWAATVLPQLAKAASLADWVPSSMREMQPTATATATTALNAPTTTCSFPLRRSLRRQADDRRGDKS
jgi:hypothetical protein